ncbi:50S ribosomal protein L25/general stress protein Ctc [Oerskovia enterophila]|uniref:Large ribosomal subunit protein bL25 n=1 Tax=Oerskovia enterophila TaxID=43678 RepID=A0A163S466_9CELL|nr:MULTISPECIES: 50S ribosomal protein L25/general stress protein Ctc [Oerskovia]KRC42515.1 50S ribosomal protein L25 [Oerskovia sp. Root22]KRD47350.1 50S ribosomal protein L25 [Oerskovia sp. Root918]KZM35996.1 50S ribosomal protein L25 [Oerskovia enterophila]OCI32658.1 50S ribosomal protein L25 [Oerskovia enterophila]
MSDIKLVAEARTEFGKGAARRTRRNNQIPAVLYGHGTDPVHVALPAHQTTLALKHSNALFTIAFDGTEVLALAKDVQRDPVKDVVEHIDLLIVKKGEKVDVDVPVHVIGEAAPGTIHIVEQLTLSIQALATNLPEVISVDITGLTAGTVVFAGDIALPEGSVLVTEPTADVVLITEPRVEATAAEVAAEAEAAPLV